MRLNLERNMRMYIGHICGVPLVEIAEHERISPARVYQIITATEYQLKTKANPVYVEEFNKFSHLK